MKRILSILCSLALMLSLAVPMATTATAAGQGRTIAVVYDNSGSMYSNNGVKTDRWSQALYAMEVFAAMLEEDDTLVLYPLNPEDGGAAVTINGGDAPDTRITKLVTGLNQAFYATKNYETPYRQVTNAANDLSGVDGERWLVVLTDGDFANTSQEALASNLLSYGDSGLNVVYLGVGSGAKDLGSSADSGRGFYAYQSGEGSDVLDKVASIANLIFQQQLLPASHISTSGSTMSLDIDIPVSRLVVFAQGEGNSSVELADGSGVLNPTAQASPQVTEADIPVKYDGTSMAASTIVGEGLQGKIATYVGSYAPGTYTLTANDPSQVQVYYIANVNLDCILMDGDTVLNSSDEHVAGTYSLAWSFVDDAGNSYDSDLLNIVSCTGTLTNQTTGDVIQLDRSTSSVTLEEGEYALSAQALLEGSDAAITCEHSYVVYPAPIDLNVSVVEAPSSYTTASLGTEGQAMVVRVTNGETGEALSEAEWQATELTISGGDLSYTWERGDDVSTFRVWPECPSGVSASQLESGSVPVTIEASYTIGNQYAYGKSSGDISFQLIAVETLELQVKLTPPNDVIDLGTFVASQDKSTGEITEGENDLAQEVGNFVRMDIQAKNPYSGSFEDLTDSQRKSLELTLTGVTESGAELNWSASYNSEGYWELKPNYAQIVAFSWKNVDWSNPKEGKEVAVSVSATAQLTDNDVLYLGTDGPVSVTVRTMSLLTLIGQIIIWLVLIFLAIFLLIGYLGKKKLKLGKKKANYHSVKPAGSFHKVAPRRVWSTYLLPYVPQRARINAKNRAANCNFNELLIVATKRNGMFRLVNYEQFLSTQGRTTAVDVNGMIYYKNDAKEKEKLKNKEFSSITLGYRDKGVTVGEFKLN